MPLKKVIFIGGFKGHNFDSFLIKFFLRDNFNIVYFKYDNSGKEKIEDSAKKLKKFIDKLKLKKEKISIIGVSMGGLIAEYYIKFLDNKKVDKLITIGSPFKGTFWAKIVSKNRIALKEMKKESKFLKKLNKKKLKNIKETNIFCKKDPITPGKSGKHLRGKETSFFLHPIMQFWPPIIMKIKKSLER